jgi:hypothetical protein
MINSFFISLSLIKGAYHIDAGFIIAYDQTKGLLNSVTTPTIGDKKSPSIRILNEIQNTKFLAGNNKSWRWILL